MPIFSLQIEKQCIGGLIKYPQVFADIAHIVNEKDFYNDFHSVAFCIIRDTINKNEKVDKVLISNKIKNLGVSFKDEINIYEYLDSISFTQITPEAVVETFKELLKIRVRRDIFETAAKLQKHAKDKGGASIDEIISGSDAIYNEKVSALSLDEEPKNLFENIEQFVEERRNNPLDEVGFATPYKEFNRLNGGLKKGNVYAFVSRSGQGKALEKDTLIPTPNGFTKIKDLQVGDEVFAVDGSITKVIGKRSWENRPLYKVETDDNHFVIVDERHEWTIQRRADYDWEVSETWDLHKIKRARPKIPTHGALQLPFKDLPLDPYILGLWLGDGTRNRPELTTNDDFILEKWKKFGRKNGLRCTKRAKYSYNLVKDTNEQNILINVLRNLGIYDKKKIPEEYLRASIDQRLALLNGLIDSDGYVNKKDGQVEFCNKNINLSKGVLELVHSLGIKASLYTNKSTLYEQDCGFRHRVHFYYDKAALLPRKLEKCKNGIRTPHRYIQASKYGRGETICIEIDHPSHLFLCGEAMIPTHNSTWLSDILFKTSLLSNFKTKVLLLDTEMHTNDLKWRIVSSLTGVPMWYLETGNWAKNSEMVEKVRAALPLANKYEFSHLNVSNKSTDQICSLASRWRYSKAGRDGDAILAYDYIKITSGDKLSESHKEHQLIGSKVDQFKRLGDQLEVPFITAMQLNRTGENFNKKSTDVVDDSTVISMSDRLQWYGTYIGILRLKTIDELALDGVEFGTHKLIKVKGRFQGRDAAGHQDLIKRTMADGTEKYVNNYINFDIQNFNVQEKGSLRHIIAAASQKHDISEEGAPDGEIDM